MHLFILQIFVIPHFVLGTVLGTGGGVGAVNIITKALVLMKLHSRVSSHILAESGSFLESALCTLESLYPQSLAHGDSLGSVCPHLRSSVLRRNKQGQGRTSLLFFRDCSAK